MARIPTYKRDLNISDLDSFLGTDGDSNELTTKNFHLGDVANYIIDKFIDPDAVSFTIPVLRDTQDTLGANATRITGSIMSQDINPDGTKITIAGLLQVDKEAKIKGKLTGGVAESGQLVLNSSLNAAGITIKAPAHDDLPTSYTMELPNDIGAAGSQLTTDGVGKVYWADPEDDDLTVTGDFGTGTIDLDTQSLNIIGGANVSTTMLDQTLTISASGFVTGTGTTLKLPIWSDGQNGVLGDSGISEARDVGGNISNITIATNQATNPLNVNFGSGGTTSFRVGTNEFARLTDEVNGFYTSDFRYGGKLTIDRDLSSRVPSLDVGDPDHTYPAAWFRNGVVVSNNPSGVSVDNTSMVIGGGNNDIVSGSDSCLAVGNNNQILNDSDNSLVVGQGNVIRNNSDNCFAIGQGNVIDGINVVGNSIRSQVLGYDNSLSSSYSSFVAGGDNTVTTGNNAFALGYSHILQGIDSQFAFGENCTGPALGQNVFMIGSALTGSDKSMAVGFRNDTSSYPAIDYANGLGKTKFTIGVGSNSLSNAMIITEGGINRGNPNVEQIPRIILPQQETLEFISDSDATAAGIPTGGLYRNGNDLKINFNETAAGGNEGLAYLTPQLLTASAGGSGNIDPNYNLLSWTLGNGVYTLNLPLASANTNRLIRITTDGSLAVGAGDKIDITATGGETIDGAASFQISKQYEGLAIYSTGSEWIIVQAKAH
jgi:hypothetical protein